ncbi:MAG: prepilin-type N-terminal cleavage/methylation domain-containing protein [Desulfovermiculus sp.]|nr:prepilin-type N-terminal cleavage/methylation domain-containing protein [Desulfovermiculus sp.]
MDKGFTLLEVLIALTIVAMAVTVYFQLISAGTKLEYQARQNMDLVVQAQQFFEQMQTRNVRDDDFKWQGEHQGCAWDLEIKPVDVQELHMDQDETTLKKETEIYSYVLTYACPEQKDMLFQRMVVVGKDFFSDEFKQDRGWQ